MAAPAPVAHPTSGVQCSFDFVPATHWCRPSLRPLRRFLAAADLFGSDRMYHRVKRLCPAALSNLLSDNQKETASAALLPLSVAHVIARQPRVSSTWDMKRRYVERIHDGGEGDYNRVRPVGRPASVALLVADDFRNSIETWAAKASALKRSGRGSTARWDLCGGRLTQSRANRPYRDRMASR
jgi:hypothetical protein